MASPIVLVVMVVMENAETVNIPALSSGKWFGIVVVSFWRPHADALRYPSQRYPRRKVQHEMNE